MSKIKLGMKKHEDCIDKLNEESKIQKTEIGNMLEYISLTKEYNKKYNFVFLIQLLIIKYLE